MGAYPSLPASGESVGPIVEMSILFFIFYALTLETSRACWAPRLGDLGARPSTLVPRTHGPLVIFTPVIYLPTSSFTPYGRRARVRMIVYLQHFMNNRCNLYFLFIKSGLTFFYQG